MNKEEKIAAAGKAFDFNKSIDKLYVTSDGTPFSQKNPANIHARTLGDSSILKVYRNGKNEESEEVELPEGSQKEESKGNDGIDPTELTDDQMVLRLVKDFTVDEMKALAKGFKFPEKDIKDLKEEELAKKLVSETTETEKELLKQQIEDKIEI